MSWYRVSGTETTLLSLHWGFRTFQMVVAVPGPVSTFGGGAVSSLGGSGEHDPDDHHLVARDEHGLRAVRATAREMVDLARKLKAAEAWRPPASNQRRIQPQHDTRGGLTGPFF